MSVFFSLTFASKHTRPSVVRDYLARDFCHHDRLIKHDNARIKSNRSSVLGQQRWRPLRLASRQSRHAAPGRLGDADCNASRFLATSVALRSLVAWVHPRNRCRPVPDRLGPSPQSSWRDPPQTKVAEDVAARVRHDHVRDMREQLRRRT
jgi:hypothetical protein